MKGKNVQEHIYQKLKNFNRNITNYSVSSHQLETCILLSFVPLVYKYLDGIILSYNRNCGIKQVG